MRCTMIEVTRKVARTLLPGQLYSALYNLLKDNPVVCSLRGETSLIESQLSTLKGSAWDGYRDPISTRNKSERVVEIPWALSRYRGERRVLDIGTSFALHQWVRHLIGLGIPELYAIDIMPRSVPGLTITNGDVRSMLFDDSFFDLIFCISTIEHIGEDNTAYSVSVRDRGVGGDVEALREIRRVLRPEGRVIVTVPFGRPQQLGWQRQYDMAMWQDLVDRGGLETEELNVFALSREGWTPCRLDRELPSCEYGEGGAPSATAVLCSVLYRSAN